MPYKEILEIAHNYFREHKIMVLIDNQDEYDIMDKGTSIMVRALVSTCFDFYYSSEQYGIFLKLALPSEIYQHIVVSLPGKEQQNTVVIQWRYKDILNFLALRVYLWICTKNTPYNELRSRFSIASFNSTENRDASKAKELLSYIMPDMCPTTMPYMFNTLAYIIKHTSRKPREILIIFEHFIHVISSTGNGRYFIEKPDAICKYIHKDQGDLYRQALAMYEPIYHGIATVCRSVLNGVPCVFVGKDLINSIKSVKSMVLDDGSTRANLSKEKNIIQDILLQSGIVGKVRKNGEFIKIGNKHFKNKKVVQVIVADFEYQIKGRLPWQDNEKYVVHPMCQVYCGCKIDPSILIYPTNMEDDGDEMYDLGLIEE